MVEVDCRNSRFISCDSPSRKCGAATPPLRTIRYSLIFTNTGSSRQETEEAFMHDHHDHAHEPQTDAHADPHAPITGREELTYYEKRVQAIAALLVEKGVVTADEIRRAVEAMDSRTPAV